MKSGLVHAVESQILDFNHLMEDLANKKADVTTNIKLYLSIHDQRLSLKQEPLRNWLSNCNRKDPGQKKNLSISRLIIVMNLKTILNGYRVVPSLTLNM
jgi:hypothetical protein